MTLLDENKVEHLILLVGGNPLPNAVAGKLLIASGGTITLIHSEDTFEVARRLEEWLKAQQVAGAVRLIEVSESSPASIVQGVQKELEAVNAKSVGLNYTGGTKVMSVHAYRAIEQWAQGKSIKTVFSYLDARTLEMVFDPPHAGSSEQREYVGRALQLSLRDLLELHGWKLKSFQKTALLPKSARALCRIFARDEKMAKAWKQWIANANDPDVKDIPPEFDELKQELNSEIKQSGKPKDWMGWLKGKWLENFVLDSLVNLSQSLYLQECAQNIEITGVSFEVDVIALRGYQLFAFSCSTDTRKDQLKLKLFEAYVRARQLGGDEARVALVCCSDDPEGLEDEMRRDVDPHIRVFGRKHLAKLDENLKEWILSQIGKEP